MPDDTARPRLDTPRPFGAHHIAPDCRGMNFYRADRGFRDLLGLYLDAEWRARMEPHFDRMGELAGGRLDELADIADKHGPVLHPRDRFGRDRVKVMLFEEMFGADPARRAELAAFLGIGFAEGPPPRMNVGGKVKSPFLAALLGNDALRNRVKRLFPLPLRTRIGQAIRTRVPTERPELDPATAAALRRRYRADTLRLEALIGRETGWPAG